jgi:hypothetical protein
MLVLRAERMVEVDGRGTVLWRGKRSGTAPAASVMNL